MSFVRSSKYRHIFGEASKVHYTRIKATGIRNDDSMLCDANPKFVAIVTHGAGGGPFLIVHVGKVGGLDTIPHTKVNGHTKGVLDVAWSPFNDNLIASVSDDTTVKLWEIPDEAGNSDEELSTPLLTLEGHEKKVAMVKWHPTAEYILATGGNDNKVIIWNCEVGEMVVTLMHPDLPRTLSWNYNGSLLATTCKDRTLRIFNPRSGEISDEKPNAIDGQKFFKCAYLKDGRIFTVGSSKMAARRYALWDPKNLKDPLTASDIDQGSGALFIHYVPDNNIIFMFSKGQNMFLYYEITNEEPYVHLLSSYTSSSNSLTGAGWMPRRGLDLTKKEIARCYKVSAEKCEPVSMIVPRKSDLFQEDIYPPCLSDEPAVTATEWVNGKDANPKTIDTKALFDKLKGKGGGAVGNKAKKTLLSLRSDTKGSGVSEQGDASSGDLAQLMSDMKTMQATLSKVCDRLRTLEMKLGEKVSNDLQ